jgi:hypothetical protein
LRWQIHITASELKDRPKAQEEFGFGAGSLTIEQKDSILVNLLIGAKTPVGNQVYLQVVGGDGVYVVDAAFLDFLPQSANDWRDTTLLQIPNSLNVIKARSGNKGFTLVRTNNSWRMTSPQQAHADAEKVADLLKQTAALRVTKFETDEPQADLESFGLQNPDMEISFANGTNNLVTLQIGHSPTNDPTQVFARLQNENHIVRIPRAPLEIWRSSPSNFVDRRIVTTPLDGVSQIEVHGENSFTLQRNADAWSIPDLPDFPVDSGLVREVLLQFNRAEVNLEKDVVTDFTSYGLAPPALEYTLRTNNILTNSVIAAIDFGTNQAGKIFERRLDEYPDVVNSVSSETFHRLPTVSWQFRDRQIWSFTTNQVMSVTIQQKGAERKIIRGARGEWKFAPGSQGILNPFSFDESLYRLGDLKAVFWIARGEETRNGFGFKETDHRISLEIKRGDKTETLTLEFGGFSEFGTRYAATTIDGARTVFEFPWPLFFEVQDSLSIPGK